MFKKQVGTGSNNCKSYANFFKWKESSGISTESNVFICDWNYPDVAEALKKRGWVQNPDPDSKFFNLKYARKARMPKVIHDWQIINHFPRNHELSAKWNLSSTIKKNQIITKIHCDSYFPRCFQLENEGLSAFCESFKLNFAQSVLKSSILTQTANEATFLSIQICKNHLQQLKSNSSYVVPDALWASLNSSSSNASQLEESTELMIKKLLNSLKKRDPQFNISGHQNIWIVKPGRQSRGRDIKLFTDLDLLKSYVAEPNYWICQKYIENPLLIHNRKFDIRQWVLITNADPLTIWIYKKCYLRFAAEPFSYEDITNNFKHLTNNSIAKNANEFEVESSMWHLSEFQQYLKDLYGERAWLNLFERIKEIVTCAVLTAGKLGRRNSFELLGFDLMVDTELTPWLIEINTSPAMDYSTPVTQSLVKEVSEDLIRVVIDYHSNQSSNTGGFELCYAHSRRIDITSSKA